MSTLTEGADKICRRLLGAGYECYLVGGSVRDRLLLRPEADLDLTTNARPADVLRLFPGSHYPNRFGTVLIDLGGHQYEVTTYRGEGRYSDHRHPDEIAFVDRLEDDLQRRDFTINSMAMDAAGEIIDPFDGRADLARRLIRAVGDPTERLAEDPLRMMRAVRLATQLGFRIESRTAAAIRSGAPLLAVISRERVRDELLKLLGARNPARGIALLRGLDLLTIVLPSLSEEAAYDHAIQSLRHTSGDSLLRLAALLHGPADTERRDFGGGSAPDVGKGQVPALTPGPGAPPHHPASSPSRGGRGDEGEANVSPLSLAGEGEGEGEIQQAARAEVPALTPGPGAPPHHPASSPSRGGRGDEGEANVSPLSLAGEGEGEGEIQQAARAEVPALTPGPGAPPHHPASSPSRGGRGDEGEANVSPLSLAGEGEGEGEIQQAARAEVPALTPGPSPNAGRGETNGGRGSAEALRRELEGLRLSNAERQRVERLIEAISLVPLDLMPTPAAARRLLSACGDSLPEVLRLVRAHRLGLGGGREAANLGQLRELRRLASEARLRGDPLSIGGLAVTGDDLVRGLGLTPGPRIGALLRSLLERVLDDPSLNDRETLLRLAGNS